MKTMKPPLIKCECCNGTGKHELSADHWRTLQMIPYAPASTSRLMLDETGVTPNAINNRLIYLERAGLIRRVGKDGKFILWEAVK
jgi:DNA-binding MarR family transcriptional regulator